jgi:hypothetical protein
MRLPRLIHLRRLHRRVRRGLCLCWAVFYALPALADAVPHEVVTPDDVLIVNGCPIWPYTRCPGVDLSHAHLVGKNLNGADLRGANLTRADLRGANLAAANLEGANFTGNVLLYALFSGSNAEGCPTCPEGTE